MIKQEKRFQEKEFLTMLQGIIGDKGFYNPIPQFKCDTLYNLAWGERSNGKSYGTFSAGMLRYVLYGEKMAIIRRWKTDFTVKTASQFFGGLTNRGIISKLTGGQYDRVLYKSKMFYLAYENSKGEIEHENDPFCYGFALTDMEHDKGGVYPENIGLVVFDEFISRIGYVPGEFALFLNAISTLVRLNNFAKIFLLGNTVSTNCPYFRNMGMKHITKQEKGKITIYKNNKEKPFISALWSDSPVEEKASNEYFQFDNPHAKMITSGDFETSTYPTCPYTYYSSDVQFRFFIVFDEEILQCNVVYIDGMTFIDINPKTTPLKDTDNDLIYSDKPIAKPNWFKRINLPFLPVQKKIAEIFKKDNLYYSDNMTGETLRNYLMWCGMPVKND